MCIRRWTVFAVMMASFSPILFAQTNDWAIVRQLAEGKKVQVETADGKTLSGKVQSITDDELRIGKNPAVQRENVRRVRLWSPGHHGRNTIIGLGVGAAVGVGFGVGACGGKDAWFSRGECAAVSAPLFGGIGAGIGALLPSRGKWQEVYEAK